MKHQTQPAEPLRGEAAWRAAKLEISKRNEAASAIAVVKRRKEEAKAAKEGFEAQRREASSLPKQPRP
jgi:hypothetical protein